MLRKSITRPIPEESQATRNWQVHLNDAPVEHVSSITVEHPRLGVLTYGQTPQGYDGWTFHEEGGGGSVILPYARVDGTNHVGVVLQSRPNQGGNVLNAPRGFLDPGEDRRMGALRELVEEVGLHAAPSSMIALAGDPGNPNSTFFETWAAGDGVTFFAVEISSALLARDGDVWIFKSGALAVTPEVQRSRAAEAISHAQFIPWCEAVRLGDLFTNAATGRLLAQLHFRESWSP